MIPNGRTQLLGLIGSQIEHSHSFHLHNACIRQQKRNALYVPMQSIQDSWDAIFKLDHFLGANITMPYKEMLLPFMDQITGRAQSIGAINTIHKQNGLLIGDNTDAIGFLSSLKQRNIDWLHRPIYIIGAGGAAKAVCYALGSIGVTKINIWNRSVQKIERIRKQNFVNSLLYWDINTPPSPKAIIIQCTPLGMLGEDPLSMHQAHPMWTVIDLLYTETPLLKRVHNAGGEAITGLGMLIHQAAHSFARWFDCPPPIDIMTNQFPSETMELA